MILNEGEIDDLLEPIYTTIISNKQKSLEKGSVWIIDLVIEHNISNQKHNPLAGISYIKLPEELDYPRKGLCNIQNIDHKECFKWSIVRYLNPSRITKADKDFAKKLDFKNTKFTVKVRKNIQFMYKKMLRIKIC